MHYKVLILQLGGKFNSMYMAIKICMFQKNICKKCFSRCMNFPLPFEDENYAKEPLEIRSFLSKIESEDYSLKFKNKTLCKVEVLK